MYKRQAAYNAGEDFTQSYHRTWAQMEIALANAEYGFFFGNDEPEAKSSAPVNEFRVVASPVPATAGFVTVNLLGNEKIQNATISLTNLQGIEVMNKELENAKYQERLNVSGLPNGLYILRATDRSSNVTKTMKIMVANGQK